DLEPILDELESIGLDFAKHSDAYSKAKQSLQELDTSFASLNKKIEDAGPRFYNLAKKEAASGFWDKYLLLIITIVILIIVVVSIGVAIPFAIKYKKKKAAEKLEDLEKPVDKKKKKGKKSKDSKKSAEKKSTEKSSAMTAPTNSAQQLAWMPNFRLITFSHLSFSAVMTTGSSFSFPREIPNTHRVLGLSHFFWKHEQQSAWYCKEQHAVCAYQVFWNEVSKFQLEVLHSHVEENEKLGRLDKRISEKIGVDAKFIRVTYNGRPIDPMDTPYSLGLSHTANFHMFFKPSPGPYCSQWLDIKRKSDGKVASMLIEPKCFSFVVWNL
nr:protein H04J21.1 [imported] - Caenorhabditis elegans [Caenorhabditis elegans]